MSAWATFTPRPPRNPLSYTELLSARHMLTRDFLPWLRARLGFEDLVPADPLAWEPLSPAAQMVLVALNLERDATGTATLTDSNRLTSWLHSPTLADAVRELVAAGLVVRLAKQGQCRGRFLFTPLAMAEIAGDAVGQGFDTIGLS